MLKALKGLVILLLPTQLMIQCMMEVGLRQGPHTIHAHDQVVDGIGKGSHDQDQTV